VAAIGGGRKACGSERQAHIVVERKVAGRATEKRRRSGSGEYVTIDRERSGEELGASRKPRRICLNIILSNSDRVAAGRTSGGVQQNRGASSVGVQRIADDVDEIRIARPARWREADAVRVARAVARVAFVADDVDFPGIDCRNIDTAKIVTQSVVGD